jgi:hypothetical protein
MTEEKKMAEAAEAEERLQQTLLFDYPDGKRENERTKRMSCAQKADQPVPILRRP